MARGSWDPSYLLLYRKGCLCPIVSRLAVPSTVVCWTLPSACQVSWMDTLWRCHSFGFLLFVDNEYRKFGYWSVNWKVVFPFSRYFKHSKYDFGNYLYKEKIKLSRDFQELWFSTKSRINTLCENYLLLNTIILNFSWVIF